MYEGETGIRSNRELFSATRTPIVSFVRDLIPRFSSSLPDVIASPLARTKGNKTKGVYRTG